MNKYEEKLKNAIYQAPLPEPDKLYEEAIIKMEEDDEITSDKKKCDFKKFFAPAISAVTCCLMIFVFWYSQNLMPYNSIDIDVNPSLEIVTNKKNKVIDIKSYNKGAYEVVDGIDYKNRDIDFVIKRILNNMLKEGYLIEGYDLLMLSTNDKNKDLSKKILDDLDSYIKDYLSEFNVSSVVLKQYYDDSSHKNIDIKGCSLGKYNLIEEIISLNPSLNEEELKLYSVRKLVSIYYELSNNDEKNHLHASNKEDVIKACGHSNTKKEIHDKGHEKKKEHKKEREKNHH